MSFLLKIVEGPNKGAEIALVSGVAVTLGKGDDCDIVLADSTLPDEPTSIEASDDGVMVDGEPLEPFAVKTAGATSFAVGPADAPWGELKWPEKDESQKTKTESGEVGRGEAHEEADKSQEDKGTPPASSPAPDESATHSEDKKRSRGGCLGCLVAIVLLIIVFLCLAWFYRAVIMDFCKTRGYDLSGFKSGKPTMVEKITLASIAANYGLSLEESDGTVKITGNLKTRAERLRATAEAYEARPGVELDLSDDESFRTAADDALFTFTEGAIKVVAATNRVLSISGVSRSPETLRRTLKALNADLPKLRDVDATAVVFGIVPKHDPMDEYREVREDEPLVSPDAALRVSKKKPTEPSLPVCGILTKPYPCLVMRDGSRVLEGAALGGSVILKIEADAVTVTNSTGRFVWKP